MRILIAYPGAIHSTYDVARGYEKALCDLGHDVYGYPYHRWIGFYQKNLRHWEIHNEEYTWSMDDVAMMSSQHLVIAAVDFEPDVVLIVSGSALHRRAYDLLHKLDLPLVLILTESPYEDETQIRIVDQGHIAHAFTNEIYSVAPLGANGTSVSYLPHSFDPDIHKPLEASDDYKSDVFFHGTLWAERAQLIEDALLDLPIDLHLSGIHVDNAMDGKVIDNEELVKFYSNAKICLNHHRTTKRGDAHIGPNDAASIGPRAYEIAACGAFQLCDERPELRAVFGHAVPVYCNAADLRARVEYFMERPDERRELAELARERVQDCTFMHRAVKFVEPVLRRL